MKHYEDQDSQSFDFEELVVTIAVVSFWLALGVGGLYVLVQLVHWFW